MRTHKRTHLKTRKAALSVLLLAALLFSLLLSVSCGTDSPSGPESDPSTGAQESPVSEDPDTPVSAPELFALTPTEPLFDPHTEKQAAYLSGPIEQIGSYADGWHECSKPEPLLLRWSFRTESLPAGSPPPDSFTVFLDRSETFDRPLTQTVSASGENAYEAAFDNLYLDASYFWKVRADCGGKIYESGVLSFKTAANAPRNLNIDGVSNVRDLGGWIIDDHHRVRQGMVFRGASFDDPQYETHITDEGIRRANEELGIGTEIELRWVSVGEIEHATESLLGPNVRYLEYEFNYGTENLLIGNHASIAKCFRRLADEKNYPVYYHCRIGTDRTGVLTYLLLGMLGVEKETLLRDYLFSNFGYVGGNRSVETIREAYLEVIDACEGETLQEKISWYLTQKCGLTDYILDKIRSLLIEKY